MLTFVGTGGKITHVLERQDMSFERTQKTFKKLLTSDRSCDILIWLSRETESILVNAKHELGARSFTNLNEMKFSLAE